MRADGQVDQLTGSDIVMGIFPSVQYVLNEITLLPGDTLALFSDGVTEAATAAGEEFGERGLAQFLANHKLEPCATVVERLAHHVRGWCGNSSFADDFTVVLVRRHQ